MRCHTSVIIKHIKAGVSVCYSEDIYLLLEVNAQKVGEPSRGENLTEINLNTNRKKPE